MDYDLIIQPASVASVFTPERDYVFLIRRDTVAEFEGELKLRCDDPNDYRDIMHEIRVALNRSLGISGLANMITNEFNASCPWYGTDQCSVAWEVGRLVDVIIHLNDNHRWTREAIADWLDTLPAQPVLKLLED